MKTVEVYEFADLSAVAKQRAYDVWMTSDCEVLRSHRFNDFKRSIKQFELDRTSDGYFIGEVLKDSYDLAIIRGQSDELAHDEAISIALDALNQDDENCATFSFFSDDMMELEAIFDRYGTRIYI